MAQHHPDNLTSTIEAKDLSQRGISFGGYRLVSLVGTGATAQVYQAERTLRGGPSKPVALKIIAGDRALDTIVQQTLLYEARVGNLIRHPNVVNIFDFGVADQRVYLAMEFVEGLTLAQGLLRQLSMPRRRRAGHGLSG